ncbi:hypothetical protein [uncultured Aquimarina sp.]|uniref:hypothetical protein n=1 Tax=uncultured Aquimarina sp. TaxID=575652 RepID=UPI00263493F0|nr:hypothetical protein [uncultured Aquimarina sp.]
MALKNRKIFSRLKTISLYSLSQILGVFSILLLSFIIIKYCSTELWGKYTEILIWSNLFLLFLGFGSQDFLLKSFSNSPSTINQDWWNNSIARSILLIPSYFIIYFIPIFKELEVLIFALITLQFATHSFKVLILYQRDFKFNIGVEIIYNLILASSCLILIDTIDLKKLILIIILGQGVRLMCYIIFYQSVFRKIKFQIQFDNVKQSMPFFIPLAVGTIRVKVDAYYGTYFFNLNTLSKYQVFLSFLTLAQMASSFALNPFLKNLYRSKNTLIRKLQGKLFWYGWGFALVMIVIMYTSITLLYELHFTKMQYILAFIIMIPLFLHVLLVNEYYKKNKQNEIAIIASILVLFQIILGYYLIKFWDMDGALILKVIGQWSIVIILWLWIRRKSIKTV